MRDVNNTLPDTLFVILPVFGYVWLKFIENH